MPVSDAMVDAALDAVTGRDDYDATWIYGSKERANMRRALEAAEAARVSSASAPVGTVRDIVDRLSDYCDGHPHARIPWPHRVLHDAIAEIKRQRGLLRELAALHVSAGDLHASATIHAPLPAVPEVVASVEGE